MQKKNLQQCYKFTFLLKPKRLLFDVEGGSSDLDPKTGKINQAKKKDEGLISWLGEKYEQARDALLGSQQDERASLAQEFNLPKQGEPGQASVEQKNPEKSKNILAQNTGNPPGTVENKPDSPQPSPKTPETRETEIKAMTGSELLAFLKEQDEKDKAAGVPAGERIKKMQNAISIQISLGNIYHDGWSKVSLGEIETPDGKKAEVTIDITNRSIAIGTEKDHAHVPVTGPMAQAIAEKAGGFMLTRKVYGAVEKAAEITTDFTPGSVHAKEILNDPTVKLDPDTRAKLVAWANNQGSPDGVLMGSPAIIEAANRNIKGKLKNAKGKLVVGETKIVINNEELQRNKNGFAIIGARLHEKNLQSGNGLPHDKDQWDYSNQPKAMSQIATITIEDKSYQVSTADLMEGGKNGSGEVTTIDGKTTIKVGKNIYKLFGDVPMEARVYPEVKQNLQKESSKPSVARAKVDQAKQGESPASPREPAQVASVQSVQQRSQPESAPEPVEVTSQKESQNPAKAKVDQEKKEPKTSTDSLNVAQGSITNGPETEVQDQISDQENRTPTVKPQKNYPKAQMANSPSINQPETQNNPITASTLTDEVVGFTSGDADTERSGNSPTPAVKPQPNPSPNPEPKPDHPQPPEEQPLTDKPNEEENETEDISQFASSLNIPPGKRNFILGDSHSDGTGSYLKSQYGDINLHLHSSFNKKSEGQGIRDIEAILRDKIDQMSESEVKGSIVTLMIGTNDIFSNLSAEDIIDKLKNLCEKIKAKGMKIVLASIPPIGNNLPDVNANHIEKWKKVNEWILKKPDSVDEVVNITNYFRDPNDENKINSQYKGTTLHYSPKGYEIVAAMISRAISKVNQKENVRS